MLSFALQHDGASFERQWREEVQKKACEDEHGEDGLVDRPLGKCQRSENEGHLGAAAHTDTDGERLASGKAHTQRHATGAEDLADDDDCSQQKDETDLCNADVEGDGKTERDEEDRPEKRIGDSVGAIVDDLDEVRMGNLLLEEQTGQIRSEDHVQADRFGEQAGGERGEQHEGEPLASLRAERQRQAGIDEAAEEEGHGEEADDFAEGDDNRQRLERPSGQQADDESKEHEGEQVVDDAAGDDYARHPGVVEPEIFEALEGDDDGRRRHRQRNEGGAHDVEPKPGGETEADAEGHDGADDGNAQGTLEGIEKLERLSLDAGVEHEEEDADLSQQLNGLIRFDQAQHRRSDEHAHYELPHDGRQSQRAQCDCDQPDAGEEDQQIEGDVVHGLQFPAVWPWFVGRNWGRNPVFWGRNPERMNAVDTDLVKSAS